MFSTHWNWPCPRLKGERRPLLFWWFVLFCLFAVASSCSHKAWSSEREREAELADFHLAIGMIEKDLFNILGKHGLERYKPEEGHDFSPSHHDALFVVPAATKEEANKIVNVVKRGYALNNRVIRPAHVGVTKHN